MKPTFLVLLLFSFVFAVQTQAQKKRRPATPAKKSAVAENQNPREAVANTMIVVDERLAVLRAQPSLYAMPVQRMRRGRAVLISGAREADGVTFYRVNLSAEGFGWMQSEAVVGKFRRGDDERLARLVQSSEGFDQIERATIFLENFPKSPLRPAMLLLFGDLIEENAGVISREATRRLNRREMAATGAPVHSFYLNYTSLDRYRRLGIGFVFNADTKILHYDGAAWKEILTKFPKSPEAAEAQKRLASLKEKLERKL
ncbi:MAG TPA: hypothetical protein VK400_16705 [Pyrinomonadaceae bacterium]|nr:hypothetical protein [Pyrinomonadaceae bacterium]